MKSRIFSKVIKLVVIFLLPVIADAQEKNDTIAVHELSEIVIQAPKVIRKPDMDVMYP